jgi:hypothetical protein
MPHIDPVEQDLNRHLHAMEVRDAEHEARIASLTNDFGTFIEALREATWTDAAALHDAFVAYTRTGDNEALGRAVRKLVDGEINVMAEGEE